jgi:hypothetical protein
MASPRSSVAPRLGRGRGLLCRRLALPAACPAGAAARPAGVAGGSSPGGCGRGIARPCGQRAVDPAAGLPREWWAGVSWWGARLRVGGACGRCGRGAGLACLGPWAGAGLRLGGGVWAVVWSRCRVGVSWSVGWRGAFGGRGPAGDCGPKCRAVGVGGSGGLVCLGRVRGLARGFWWAGYAGDRVAKVPGGREWRAGAIAGLVWRGGAGWRVAEGGLSGGSRDRRDRGLGVAGRHGCVWSGGAGWRVAEGGLSGGSRDRRDRGLGVAGRAGA